MFKPKRTTVWLEKTVDSNFTTRELIDAMTFSQQYLEHVMLHIQYCTLNPLSIIILIHLKYFVLFLMNILLLHTSCSHEYLPLFFRLPCGYLKHTNGSAPLRQTGKDGTTTECYCGQPITCAETSCQF